MLRVMVAGFSRLTGMTILILAIAVAVIAVVTVIVGVFVVRGPAHIRELERRQFLAQRNGCIQPATQRSQGAGTA